MQTPPQIEFQNLSPTQAVRDAIEKHVDGLEQRWGRVTACRVVVKGPSQRHHTGGLYDIHILLRFPTGARSMSNTRRRRMNGAQI